MFLRGTMKSDGIDVTIKNNPGHVLAPDSWDMVMGVRFGKVKPKEYEEWYQNLIRKRWEERKLEFIALAKEGKDKDIRFKCYCPLGTKYCHAEIAVKFMNALMQKIR